MLCWVEPSRNKMKEQQLQMWSADPHPTPPIYQKLTSEERRQLVEKLARLILRQVQDKHPDQSNITIRHER